MALGLPKNWFILITAAYFALPFCHILFLVLLVILVYRSSLDPPETGAGSWRHSAIPFLAFGFDSAWNARFTLFSAGKIPLKSKIFR